MCQRPVLALAVNRYGTSDPVRSAPGGRKPRGDGHGGGKDRGDTGVWLIRKARLPLAAALVSFAFFFLALAFPWQLSLLLALAIGALVWSTLRTVENLRVILAPMDYGVVPGSGARLTPGEDGEGREQQKVHENGRSQTPEEQRQPTGAETTRENESA